MFSSPIWRMRSSGRPHVERMAGRRDGEPEFAAYHTIRDAGRGAQKEVIEKPEVGREVQLILQARVQKKTCRGQTMQVQQQEMESGKKETNGQRCEMRMQIGEAKPGENWESNRKMHRESTKVSRASSRCGPSLRSRVAEEKSSPSSSSPPSSSCDRDVLYSLSVLVSRPV